MARITHIKNYNNLNGGVVTDLTLLDGAPANAVRDALNFEFSSVKGASRRKALDLESGISGNDYTQLDSALGLGEAKHQVFTFKSVLDSLDTPTHDIVFSTFEGGGITYNLGSDQQLSDAVADGSVTGPSAINSGTWKGVAWSPKLGIYAAVSNLAPSDTQIGISTDSLTWSFVAEYSTPGATPSLEVITWSDDLEKFVGFGANASATSSDGIYWEVYAPGGAIFAPQEIIWAAELSLFISLGNPATPILKTSPDGITWTTRVSYTTKNWSSVTWSSSVGLLVAVSTGGTATQRVMTSPDGITWTLRTTPATDRAWYTVEWVEELGKFFAVGDSDYTLHSPDGTTWSETQSGGLTVFAFYKDLSWSADLAILVAVGGSYISTSTDGTTWIARSLPSGVNFCQAMDWSPGLGKFVGVSSGGTNRMMTSTDGITWTAVTLNTGDSSQDWINFQGVMMGAVSSPELSVLYNTDATTYELVTTFGLGTSATIRDFTGASDNLAIDQNPSVMTFNVGSITGTFTTGEQLVITNGTVTRRFKIIDLRSVSSWGVDKSTITSVQTEFDGADTTDYSGYSVTGQSSGATATMSSVTGLGLSDAHRYNLINQGWTQTHMNSYASSRDVWPSNAQTWYSGRDSSNNFSPTELDKVAFGNSESPKGHILLDPFREWRHAQVPGVWSGAVPNATYTRGFTTIAKFGSRVAMSGTNINGVENAVYISPVLIDRLVTVDSPDITDLDFSEVFKFHQRNDPTADLQNELLPDDGVVIPITGANRIYKLVELSNALLVIADNGVWAISGLDLASGFLTDAFSVYKVTGATGSTNSRSVVATSEVIYYWASDGIYAVTVEQDGRFTAANITINRIGELYKQITPEVRESTIGYYDQYNHKVYWAYNGETTATYPEFRNKLLVLDLAINAFYPLKTPEKLTDDQGHLSTYYMSINGFTQDKGYPESDGTIPLKLFVTQTDGTDWYHSVMEFNNSGSTNFDDFKLWRTDVHSDADAGVDEECFIETWPDTLGDTSRTKQPLWVFTHMTKTETGWSDNGDGSVSPVGESSLYMRSQWDWHDTTAGGRWGNQREIYRHKRPYVPVDDTDLYDTGESVISTKNKVYGEGMALGLRFDAQANKDAVLLGFAIPYTIAGAP